MIFSVVAKAYSLNFLQHPMHSTSYSALHSAISLLNPIQSYCTHRGFKVGQTDGRELLIESLQLNTVKGHVILVYWHWFSHQCIFFSGDFSEVLPSSCYSFGDPEESEERDSAADSLNPEPTCQTKQPQQMKTQNKLTS